MERALWVVALVAVAGLVIYGMRLGWVHRARRQAAWFPEFPQAPDGVSDEQEILSATGLYVGTTTSGDWQDRIAVGDIGHRAAAVATLRRPGLLLERAGASPLWIPTGCIRDARVDHKLANKVVPGVGLLIVTWQLGDQRLDTGFRGDDRRTHHDWVEAIRALVPAEPTRESQEEH
jgi:hypothetical protein